MKIFVFKTNLKNEYQKEMITPAIKQIHGITKWNVDFDDKNRALRIEGHGLNSKHIESVVRTAGFECEQMY
jgi:copper chaperone CopZ